MAMHVKLRFIYQEQFDEDLDVVAAFAKNPDAVRDALCKAICQVELPTSELKLLSIANSFQSALQKPWVGYKPLRSVLEAYRQKKYGRLTERLFHKHSQEAGVVALGLVAKHQNKLIDEIDALAEIKLIKLAKLVKRIPKKTVINEFIDFFSLRTACRCTIPLALLLTLLIRTSIRNPFPTFARPRVRSNKPSAIKQPNAAPTKDTRSSSHQSATRETQDISPTKRRRLSPTIKNQNSLKVNRELSCSYEGGFPRAQPDSPPTQRAPPSNQSHTQRDHAAHNSSLGTRQYFHIKQQQPSHRENETWDITKSFMDGRPLEFHQELQMTDQGEQWGSSQGRAIQLQIMGDKWEFAESFLDGRPLEFGSQEIQTINRSERAIHATTSGR